MTSSIMTFDTAILGAGMAGLSTAFHLLVDNTYDGTVALLEARDRIGGRIHSTELGGKCVQLGANWVHGIINNPVYALASRFELIDPLCACDDTNLYCDQNVCAHTNDGSPVPIELVRSAYDIFFRMMKQCELLPKQPDPELDDSAGRFLRQMIAADLEKRPTAERVLYAAMYEQMMHLQCCINGCADMNQVSLSGLGKYEELPGGNLVLPTGFGALIEQLLKRIRQKLSNDRRSDDFQLLLKHEVKSIHWQGIAEVDRKQGASHSDATMEALGGNWIRIECANGKQILARHVVCTLPVGVLKNSPGLYQPPLPAYKRNAIDGIGIDCVNKILLEYDSSLCPHHWDQMVDELFCINLPAAVTGDNAGYSLERDWPKKIYSFSRLNNRVLLCWVFGEEARHVAKLMLEQVNEIITEHLRKLTGKRDFPLACRVLVTNWGRDPYTLGSYSFIKKGGKQSYFEELAEPIFADPAQDKPCLLFAGEACHTTFFSTTHGAFLSGKRAATYLLDTEKPDNGDGVAT